MKGHPVLLNRAPTLHRLGIQAFQPKLIEGKAIQLHPLACTAFNADFDGDQMAVHLPLGNEAILEAQMLMLGAHNILNPANGAPITVPSQDMVLGLYYITKLRRGDKGEGHTFYGPEEAEIAYNEGRVTLHAPVNVMVDDVDENGNPVRHLVKDTSVGRVLVNQYVPKEIGYVNTILSKKSLRNIIALVIKKCGIPRSARFLDDIKNLGYRMAFQGGLSFNLGDVIIPPEKEQIVAEGYERVNEVMENYQMGFISDKERYQQIIDIWTQVNAHLTSVLMKQMSEANQGFNAIYMMLDSGARGSKDQIRQLAGMRGLMAKPQKAGAEGGQIIENPILANFKEGLSVLEYFISTHGARKGLADTALKTADAGYLTRRLVDVAHDVIINEQDCGTLRGLVCTAIKNNDEIVASLGERILGRVSVHDIVHPLTGEIIVRAGEEIKDDAADIIDASPIESVEIRSVLTCESKRGVCAKCYGRNLANNRMVQKGEAVGVIAAQSIGEPGTQLTLRTFHVGGVASNIAAVSKITSRYEGTLEIDELRTVTADNGDKVVVGRLAEMRIIDPNTKLPLMTANIPYGAKLFFNSGDIVKKDDVICEWDPFNAVIVSEVAGKIHYRDLIENITYRVDSDGQHQAEDRVIIESRDRQHVPSVDIVDKKGNVLASYTLPVGAHIIFSEGDDIKVGEPKKYLVPLSKQILVQENDIVRAGTPLSDGAITPTDILNIMGPTAVQEYIVNEVQDVYRMQGVKINDKHFEVIVRQMMRKVRILDAGDTNFLEEQIVDKREFMDENDRIWGMKYVIDAGDSENYQNGQIITARRLRDENSLLKQRDLRQMVVRDAQPATSEQILQGITRAALQTSSFISAASFQETTKVLNEAAIQGKSDSLEGMKENVICGHLIPAGTGLREFERIVVGSNDDIEPVFDRMDARGVAEAELVND